MWKKFISKIFCLHKWETHAKVEREALYIQNRVVNTESTEILICTECGKIKKLVY